LKTIKAEAKALEKAIKGKYGPWVRFNWDSYDVEKAFYRSVPDDFTDLWHSTDQHVRQNFRHMVNERYCSEDERSKKKYRRDCFTRSLVVGAKWIHQVDGQVTVLQKLMRARQDAVQ
jgi:hypothetical protein